MRIYKDGAWWIADDASTLSATEFRSTVQAMRFNGWTYKDSTKQWGVKAPKAVLPFDRFLDPAYAETLVSAVSEADRRYAMSNALAPDPSMPSVNDEGLYPFQRIMPPELINRNLLLADEMGLGKTIQAIAAINLLKPENVLIVAPNMLIMNWYDELSTWQAYKGTNIYLVPWSRLVKLDTDIRWDLAIIDEAHYAKNPSSKRSQAFSRIKADRRLCLTGTPILGKPMEIWPIIQWVEPYIVGDKNYFEATYTTTRLKTYRAGGRTHYYNEVMPANIPQLQTRLRESIMISRTKSLALAGQLPEKIRTVVTLESSAELKKLDSEMNAVWKQVQKDASKDMALWANLFKMRKEAALLKVPKINAFIENILEETDSPVIIWTHHHEVSDAIENHFKRAMRTAVLDGRKSPELRAQLVRDFQTGDIPLLIAGMTAAGVGITLTASNVVIFAELDWTPANMLQAEDRAYRIGTTKTVAVYYCVTQGSIDGRIAGILAKKQAVIDDFTIMSPPALLSQPN